MHLLLVREGTVAETGEAQDLGQSPADIVFLSAADTELACLAVAKGLLGEQVASLRLANLQALTHPMSVDLYVKKTAYAAKLIIVRVLGGQSYWRYGLETLYALACENNSMLAIMPGDNRWDPDLMQFSTLHPEKVIQLWHYLSEGGSENAQNFLYYCQFLLFGGEKPKDAMPVPKAGFWGDGIHSSIYPLPEAALLPTQKPVIVIIFYRALVQSGQTAPVDALIKALQQLDLMPLAVFVTSLKDETSMVFLEQIFALYRPDLVLNATGFALASSEGGKKATLFENYETISLQVVFSSTNQNYWQTSQQGLSVKDMAMNVSLPEMDGRIFSRAVAFKDVDFYDHTVEWHIVTYHPVQDRIDFVAQLAANWIALKHKKRADRHIALIMSSYPGKDGRLGYAVGLDTPESVIKIVREMQRLGYQIENMLDHGDALIQSLSLGPTQKTSSDRIIRETLSLQDYQCFFSQLPDRIQQEIKQRWGEAEQDAFFSDGFFALPLLRMGNCVIGIQPERSWNMDVKQAYHATDIVPTHHYMAFYFWLRHSYRADALVHIGKHGNLEWLPGKALALSDHCYPELALGPLPHIYPFIVNDPGEGTQAKRRSSAVIIDHMTPPLMRAELYGPLKDLEALVDEYYEASFADPRRLLSLKTQILELVEVSAIAKDVGIDKKDALDTSLQKLDAFLCDLKELQIRDGFHIFGTVPEGEKLTHTLVALARAPRGSGAQESLHRAIAHDLHLDFDPLQADMSKKWCGIRPALLQSVSDDPWRTYGDTVERIEKLCCALVSREVHCLTTMCKTMTILQEIEQEIQPLVCASGENELKNLFLALDGRFVPPGPSGAPTRGRLDVLPTGRNFFSLDSRSLPTQVAFTLGKVSAEALITRYVQDHGQWPTSFGVTLWGTANMRTGGDDIAQILAFIGVNPVWDKASLRVISYEIISLAQLGRPRIDVTVRISGFFRDAFPEQIALLDAAIRAVGQLDEEGEDNPLAMRMQTDVRRHRDSGMTEEESWRQAGYRIFGARPGCYGTAVPEFMEKGQWDCASDLGRIWTEYSSHAYGVYENEDKEQMLKIRLAGLDAIIQSQDNREHDILDSGEYYAFTGGMAAAVKQESGQNVPIYHHDHSLPGRAVIKTLAEEIGHIVHGRAAHPKWIAAMMRHGYRGGAEMAATVDYLFAFAALTPMETYQHFDKLYQAYLGDDTVREFLSSKNPAALKEISSRFYEAIERHLWAPRSNQIYITLDQLRKDK